MLGLLRDWLLDPAAWLFLASIALGVVLVVTSNRRLKESHLLQGSNLSRPRAKRKSLFSTKTVLCIAIWLLFYEVVSAPIFVNLMVNQLEKKYGTYESCPAGSSHVVLLSGGVDSSLKTVAEFERMKPATFVRATLATRILAEEPDASIIVSGGALYRVPEADVIGHYLTSLGIDESRQILESESRNTHENALNVAAILAEEEVKGPILLVTSAMHMHRAYKSFELALADTDIAICPASVDFQGLPRLQIYAWMPQMTSLVKFDHLLHELVALALYRLKGWI